MPFAHVLHTLPPEETLALRPRPYFNHAVELKKRFTAAERAQMLEAVGLNVFYFPAEMVTGCDLLSDSGTTTMTNEQWAALHLGDEAYGSNRGYFLLRDQIRETFGEAFFDNLSGPPNAFIFHQGRPAEDALFSAIGRLGHGLIIPSNGHFDTTQANIEVNGMLATNLFAPELTQEHSTAAFKGNIDLARLQQLLASSHAHIPVVYLTVTNNTGGGQPVSMQNIRDVAQLVHAYDIPLFLDACRFAENAWFIKHYEPGYTSTAIPDIVREMFSYVDGCTISFKKDGLVNMGGGLFLRQDGVFTRKYPQIPDALMNHQITREGHPTYGGMSGRDIMSLVTGLRIVIREDYLTYRIRQVQDFGTSLRQRGLPVLMPAGGHAVYLDINKFFADTAMRPADFGGVALTAILLAAYGHRAVELGNFAFGKWDPQTGQETFPEVNFVRFAIPRLRYERDDLEAVAEALHLLYERRREIPPITVTYGKDLPLRHFKARFAFGPSKRGHYL
jgi:tryptophanase